MACLLIAWMLIPISWAQAYVLGHSHGTTPARWNLRPGGSTPTNTLNPQSLAIRYTISSDAWSETNRTAELNAIRASFDQWQAVPGTNLKFEEAPLAPPNTPFNTADGTNLIYWTRTDKRVPGSRDDIGASLALTFVSITNGVIHEADMIINGSAYEWFTDITDTNSTKQFVEATVLHEIGHFIGLEHSTIGAATMFPFGLDGIDPYIGLSTDDIAGVRALYATPTGSASLGRIHGRILRDKTPLMGAVILLEDSAGNATISTLSLLDGSYEISAIPPGNYSAGVSRLDPDHLSNSLVRGRDISLYFSTNFIETAFLSGTNRLIQILPGSDQAMDFDVVSGTPPPRITSIRVPSAPGRPSFHSPTAASVSPGQSNVLVGVYSTEFPQLGGVLRITGTGLRIGLTSLESGGNLRGRLATIDVLPDAKPGLRSFVVEWEDGRISKASGFLEIRPRVRDDNFDGLDDLFQRQHFQRFTSPEAGPNADPDGDGLNNAGENIAGTNPLSSGSVLKIRSVTIDGTGASVGFDSVPGRRYQLQFKESLNSSAWKNIGASARAVEGSLTLKDPDATDFRFYRVLILQ